MSDEYQTDAVTKVARDLTEIVELHARLLSQAVQHGDHKMMPGGQAMVALGNVANMEAWENMQQATERYQRAYTSVEDEDPDEAWSPFQLLEFWSEQWRREHNAEYDQRPTIATEANFLRFMLSWARENELAWDDFAQDIRQARLKLENILTDGKRAERTRVKCPNPECPHPRNLLRLVGVAGREDVWKCSACKSRYDHADFKRAEARQMNHDEKAQRFIPVREAIEVLKTQGRQERTVRGWLRPPVEHVGDRCSVCKRKWPPQEYAACPGRVADSDESCGGELRPIRRRNRGAIVGGFCDIGTRKTFVWWPDLWTRHLLHNRKDLSA